MVLKLDKAYRWSLLLVFTLMLPIAASAQVQTHIVKRGDTLYSLGRTYGMSVPELQELNGLESSNLYIGQVLKVKSSQTTIEPGSPAAPSAATTARPIQRSSLAADFFYQIKRGDNLYRIAREHDISVRDIVSWNDFAGENAPIFPGQRIIIKDPATAEESPLEPTEDETSQDALPSDEETVIIEKVYVVQPKDTLFGIARANNMSVSELKRINSLSSDAIRVGQKLILAGSPRAVDQATLDRLTQEELLKQDRIRDDLAAPVEGTVISEYGLRNGRPHKGIDISAKNGTPILAVLDGTVVYSGAQGAYGNVIVLEHPDFVMTVYAHNEKNMVEVGAKVTKGQQIATVGSTGNATGPHLHFEYRIKGKAINPRKVLPLD